MFDSIPAQASEQCPNCGKWYVMGSCCHSSNRRIEVTLQDGFSKGVISSTLYGVCSNCARVHEGVLTPRALDGAKAPRKSKRSTGSPRK